jgi:hypothetical protein
MHRELYFSMATEICRLCVAVCNPAALSNFGNSHYGQGRPDEARGCFARALALEPNTM